MLKDPFQAIIFDLDGVIINSETLWDESSYIFLKRRGLIYERAQVKPLCTGKSLIDGTAIMKEFYKLPEAAADLAYERKSIVRELYQQKISFIAGCESLVQLLIAQQIPVAIATSSDDELLELVKQKLDLTRLFGRHIYSVAQVNHQSKPSPALFLFTAQQLHLRPAACMVIEDSPIGILAAKNAGMFCIAIQTTYEAALLSQADCVLENYLEIEDYLFNE